MRIFLVRHGDADAEVPEGLSDDARALTARGRQLLWTHFSALTDRMTNVGLIVTSPLVRAVQTAQILSLAQKHEGPLRVHRALVPDMPVGSLEALIHGQEGHDLILVGHQPSMGAMAAHLLGMPSFPKQVSPGTVIALDRPDGADTPARLLFYAAPGQALLETLS